MQKLFTLFYLTFLPIFSVAQGVTFFEGSFEQALTKAKENNKPLFVEVYPKDFEALEQGIFSDHETINVLTTWQHLISEQFLI